VTSEKWIAAASLAAILPLLAVCASAFAAAQEADPCVGWREKASETMFRVAAAESRVREGLPLLQDLIGRLDAGEVAARTAFERQRKRYERTVEDGVTASRLAAYEAKRLDKRLKEATDRCRETDLHAMRWAHWWFENHGPVVKMRAGYLAAARFDFPRAESIFEEVIASGRNSDNPNYAGLTDRAKRSLEIVKTRKVPFIPPERSYQERENPGKVPAPEYIPKPAGGQP